MSMRVNKLGQGRFTAPLKIMTSAEGLIRILATYRNLGSWRAGPPQCEDCIRAIMAVGAERLELLDIVCKGDQVKELTEGPALGVAVKTHTDDVLAVPLYSGQGEGAEVGKELGLLDDDGLRGGELGGLKKGSELAHGHSGIGLLVVADNAGLRRVAGVKGRSDAERLPADDLVAPHDAEDCRGLPCEHGAEKEIEGHSGAW